MAISVRRRAAAMFATAAMFLALAFPGTAWATITGPCTATGTATSSGSIDLTNEEVWRVKSTDVLSGNGTSTVTMRSGEVSAYALGLEVPIRSESGDGDTSGSVDGVSMDLFSKLGKVFVIAGAASGDGECEGQILVVVDDVDAVFTVLGGGGLAMAIIGLAAVLMSSRSSGCLSKGLAVIFGGLGGVGLALSLEQFQVLSPTSYIGLAIVVVGAILGLILAGRFAGAGNTPAPADGRTARAAPPVPPPPVAASPAAPVEPPRGEGGHVIDDAVNTGAEILQAGDTRAPAAPQPTEGTSPPVAPPPPVDEGARELLEEVGGPAVSGDTPPSAPGQQPGRSHTIPSDPDNPPRGGGGPM